MQGIACKNGDIADDITSLCFDNGMIIETAGPEDEVIKFFSPLTVSEAEMEKGLQIFVKSVEQHKKRKAEKKHHNALTNRQIIRNNNDCPHIRRMSKQ